jgi:hypothetical protein
MNKFKVLFIILFSIFINTILIILGEMIVYNIHGKYILIYIIISNIKLLLSLIPLIVTLFFSKNKFELIFIFIISDIIINYFMFDFVYKMMFFHFISLGIVFLFSQPRQE